MIDHVWIFDINHRVYPENKRGFSNSPIWKKHWVKHEIVSETSRSWVTKWGKKVPKKGSQNIAFSEEEINKAAYIHDNAYKISENVRYIKDHDLLLKVAELIGYEGEQ